MDIETGVVVNNKDPLKLGRVQVRIFGVTASTENVNNDTLPWADVIGSNEFGLVGGTGISSVLHQGTSVWVSYLSNNGIPDKTRPIVLGTCHKNENESNGKFGDPDGKFPQVKGGTPYNSASQDATQYGCSTNIHTESGHDIMISDKGGDEKIKIFHKSGSYIEMDHEGNINIYAKKNLKVTAEEEISFTSNSKSISSTASSGGFNTDSKTFSASAQSGATINGGSSCDISASSTNINGGGGDAKISGISLISHTHGEAHSGTTTPPN